MSDSLARFDVALALVERPKEAGICLAQLQAWGIFGSTS